MEIADALGEVSTGETIPLTFTGELNDGTPFDAVDCVLIVGGKKDPPPTFADEGVVLNAPAPNPFNPTTRISYVVQNDAFVELIVYNANGKFIDRLVAKNQSAGEHVFNWSAKELPSGVYFCRMKAGEFTEVKKLMLSK